MTLLKILIEKIGKTHSMMGIVARNDDEGEKQVHLFFIIALDCGLFKCNFGFRRICEVLFRI